jgi:hypothetical protein
MSHQSDSHRCFVGKASGHVILGSCLASVAPSGKTTAYALGECPTFQKTLAFIYSDLGPSQNMATSHASNGRVSSLHRKRRSLSKRLRQGPSSLEQTRLAKTCCTVAPRPPSLSICKSMLPLPLPPPPRPRRHGPPMASINSVDAVSPFP